MILCLRKNGEDVDMSKPISDAVIYDKKYLVVLSTPKNWLISIFDIQNIKESVGVVECLPDMKLNIFKTEVMKDQLDDDFNMKFVFMSVSDDPVSFKQEKDKDVFFTLRNVVNKSGKIYIKFKK